MVHRRDAGHEKKPKNHQNCKFCLNEIKYLQLLIFAKRDFFSRPPRARTVNPAFPLFGCGSAALGLRGEVSFPLSVTAPASIEVYPSHFTIQESSGSRQKNPSQIKASSIPRQTQRQSINFTVMGPCGIPLACRKFAHSLHDFLAGQKPC